MPPWIERYLIAGLCLEIRSEVGDPTPYLPGSMSGFAWDAEPEVTVLLYEDEEAHADPLRRFFPPRFTLVNCEEGLVFAVREGGEAAVGEDAASAGRGRLRPLGSIEEGGGSARMGMPPLDRAWRIPQEQEAVREALQGFVRACLQCRLLERGGTMVHAAGVVFGGAGFVLAGHTRSGKTTISRQFPRDAVLGDDLVAVSAAEAGFILFGTPWPGREGGCVSRGGFPLRAVFLLHPEGPHGLQRCAPADSLAELVANGPRMGDPAEESKLLDIFSSLVEEVPIYKLGLGLGGDAVPFFERALEEGHGGKGSGSRPRREKTNASAPRAEKDGGEREGGGDGSRGP